MTLVLQDPFAAARIDAREITTCIVDGPIDAFVVLGSGLGEVAGRLGTVVARASVDVLHHTARPSVAGHAGELISVRRGAQRVLVAAGRTHFYEGHSPDAVSHLVRAARFAGASRIVLTNAVGSLRPEWRPGTLVTVADHLNLTGANPLRGPHAVKHAPVFIDLSECWSPHVRAALVRHGLDEACYAQLPGPSYETPSEIRMLSRLGADTVGMSCVLEAIAARHLGAEVVGIQLVTNLAAGIGGSLDHDEVLAAGAAGVESAAEAISVALDA